MVRPKEVAELQRCPPAPPALHTCEEDTVDDAKDARLQKFLLKPCDEERNRQLP